jgi:hypothetical protein
MLAKAFLANPDHFVDVNKMVWDALRGVFQILLAFSAITEFLFHGSLVTRSYPAF